VNAGSVASPPTTWAPRNLGASAAVDGDDVVPVCEETLHERATDLAGAEDDVAGHDAISSLSWRMRGPVAGRR
jgi:hypothetical protein